MYLYADSRPGWGSGGCYNDLSPFGARSVLSVKMYFARLGTAANHDDFLLNFYGPSEALYVDFASGGVSIYSSGAGSSVLVSTGFAIATWQVWTFDVNWTTRTVDAYLNGVLQASGAGIYNGSESSWNGTVFFIAQGGNVADDDVYVDWLKIGDGFVAAPVDALQISGD